MGYIGSAPSRNTPAYKQVYEFVATAAQTTFSVAYTVGFVEVYRNGVKLGAPNFTANNGTSVVLTSGANAGDFIQIVSEFINPVLNAIPNTTGAVATSNIADNAITTAKIAAGAVIAADIASGQTFALNGIQFPSTQVPSGDANTLDDYEEGTFTPVLTGSGGSAGSYAASQAEGVYTKIGNLVIATAAVSLSNLGSWSGAVRCSMPFTVGQAIAKGSATRSQFHTFTGTIVPDGDGNVAYCRFNLTASGAGQTNWQWSSLSSTGGNFINFTFIYQV